MYLGLVLNIKSNNMTEKEKCEGCDKPMDNPMVAYCDQCNDKRLQEIEKGHKIFSTTIHKFGFKARLLVLFGMPLKQYLAITVDKEVKILKVESSGYIRDLFDTEGVSYSADAYHGIARNKVNE